VVPAWVRDDVTRRAAAKYAVVHTAHLAADLDERFWAEDDHPQWRGDSCESAWKAAGKVTYKA
jgi:hypothetical protein